MDDRIAEAEAVIRELMSLVTVDQLRCIVSDLRTLQKTGRGELILTVKNSELAFLDTRTGRTIRKTREG